MGNTKNTKPVKANEDAAKASSSKKVNFAEGKDYVFGFIKTIIDKHGPRLPGSEEEHAASYDIEKYIGEATGKEVIREPFKVSPVASIGAIPIIGLIGFLLIAFYYVNPIIALVIALLTFAYAVIQIFMYKGWFDKLWVRHDSQNLYSVIDGSDKIDYTIMLSGHMDSSWNWNHSINTPQFFIIKLACFLVSFIAIIVFSIIRISIGYSSGIFGIDLNHLVLTFGPILLVPGFYFGATFLSWDKKIASPGAMDNLSGIGAAMYMGKYYRENPEKLPKNCRIIVAALGSEEAGLKGSMAFVALHKNDKNLLINPINLNIDSMSDYDHFGVITGDLWQMTNFDPELIKIATDVFKSMGLKTQAFKNPIGGCDSTPFCKIGIPTVTLCAQNPVPTNYYHTTRDHYDRLDVRTIEKGLEAVVKITEKIQQRNGKLR